MRQPCRVSRASLISRVTRVTRVRVAQARRILTRALAVALLHDVVRRRWPRRLLDPHWRWLPRPIAASRPPPAVNASAVAAPDAAGVVDPRRAFLLRDVFAQDRDASTEGAGRRAARLRRSSASGARCEHAGRPVGRVCRAGRSQRERAGAVHLLSRRAGRHLADDRRVAGVDRPARRIRPFHHADSACSNIRPPTWISAPRARRTKTIFAATASAICGSSTSAGRRANAAGARAACRRCASRCMPPTPTGSNRLLGIRHSKGCVRIPASLNTFLDHYGILDAEYAALVDSGKSLWVLKSDRQIMPWAGRYIVVVDSARKSRPAWALGARQQGAREGAGRRGYG